MCLLDLDLQYGSVATYLDLPRREVIFELLSDTAQMDAESFGQALLSTALALEPALFGSLIGLCLLRR